jgi:hypothetical protein
MMSKIRCARRWTGSSRSVEPWLLHMARSKCSHICTQSPACPFSLVSMFVMCPTQHALMHFVSLPIPSFYTCRRRGGLSVGQTITLKGSNEEASPGTYGVFCGVLCLHHHPTSAPPGPSSAAFFGGSSSLPVISPKSRPITRCAHVHGLLRQ